MGRGGVGISFYGVETLSCSAEQTERIGLEFGRFLPSGSLVSLIGDLGAGKTTLMKGLVYGATKAKSDVQSPTFTYLNIYYGEKTVYHFDLYRLKDSDDFLGMGFEDYLESDGICCLEWPERIAGLLPLKRWEVTLAYAERKRRQIEITYKG